VQLHNVWFVIGGLDLEYPVWLRSWWNMGQESSVDCVPRFPEALWEPVALDGSSENSECNNTVIKKKKTTIFLFILSDFLPSYTLMIQYWIKRFSYTSTRSKFYSHSWNIVADSLRRGLIPQEVKKKIEEVAHEFGDKPLDELIAIVYREYPQYDPHKTVT